MPKSECQDVPLVPLGTTDVAMETLEISKCSGDASFTSTSVDMAASETTFDTPSVVATANAAKNDKSPPDWIVREQCADGRTIFTTRWISISGAKSALSFLLPFTALWNGAILIVATLGLCG